MRRAQRRRANLRASVAPRLPRPRTTPRRRRRAAPRARRRRPPPRATRATVRSRVVEWPSSHERPAQRACAEGNAITCALLTLDQRSSILPRMTPEQANHRFDLELKRLEKRLEELVVVCRQLQEENKSLRARQDSL